MPYLKQALIIGDQGWLSAGSGDLAHSQKLLPHKNSDMTERYARARIGERVKPLRKCY
jgi:hypothetical protein